MFPRQRTELSLSCSTCYPLQRVYIFKTSMDILIFFYTPFFWRRFPRHTALFCFYQGPTPLFVYIFLWLVSYCQEAVHLLFWLGMLILNYSLVYSGIHSFMITRNSSFYSYSTSWIWLSFLFAVWIAHDFPKRPMLRSYPLNWTAVKCTGAGAANLGTRAC